MWDGNRNPVAYRSLEELNINLEDLQFHKLEQETDVLEETSKLEEKKLEKISIPEAKRLLANYFDVPQENISITINM